MTGRADKLLRDPQQGFSPMLPLTIMDAAGMLSLLCGAGLILSLSPDSPLAWRPVLGGILLFCLGAFLTAFLWRRWEIRMHAKLASIAWEGGETTARALNVVALYAQEATIYGHIAMRHHRQAAERTDEKPEERHITSADFLTLVSRHRIEGIDEWATLDTLRTGALPGGRVSPEEERKEMGDHPR